MGGSKHAREVIQDIVPVRVKRVADPRAVLEDTRQGFHRYQPRLVQCLGARQIVCSQEPKLPELLQLGPFYRQATLIREGRQGVLELWLIPHSGGAGDLRADF